MVAVWTACVATSVPRAEPEQSGAVTQNPRNQGATQPSTRATQQPSHPAAPPLSRSAIQASDPELQKAVIDPDFAKPRHVEVWSAIVREIMGAKTA